MCHLNLIANILNNAGFITEVKNNRVLVSLKNQIVYSIDVQKVLMKDDIDELCNIEYLHSLKCVSVSI